MRILNTVEINLLVFKHGRLAIQVKLKYHLIMLENLQLLDQIEPIQ